MPDPDSPDLTVGDIRAWELQVMQSGRGCRDTVGRICRWHQRNGHPDLDCGEGNRHGAE